MSSLSVLLGDGIGETDCCAPIEKVMVEKTAVVGLMYSPDGADDIDDDRRCDCANEDAGVEV